MRLLASVSSQRDPGDRSTLARRAVLVALVAACCVAGNAGAPARAAGPDAPGADTKAGEALFNLHCAACHADGGNLIDPKKPVRGSAKLKDFETFVAWIRAPLMPMVPFPPDQISDVQAKELYRYVAEVLSPQTPK